MGYCAYLGVQPDLIDQNQVQQPNDEKLAKILTGVERFVSLGYQKRSDDCYYTISVFTLRK